MAVGTQRTSARRSSVRDVQIGNIVRQHRLANGLTQSALAGQLGVTFQQIQKYENGKNRISSGRLQSIADALDIPVSAFYAHVPIKKTDAAALAIVSLTKIDGATRLLRAFQKIGDIVARKAIITIAETLAS